MAATTPFNTGVMEDAGTPESRGESLLTDDTTICEELIAPLEATMMRSIWRIVRNADLAEDSLQDALAVIWKNVSRFADTPILGH
jgi:DNA-directed RNA polymerase specialized sigma24 family protein